MDPCASVKPPGSAQSPPLSAGTRRGYPRGGEHGATARVSSLETFISSGDHVSRSDLGVNSTASLSVYAGYGV